MFVLWRKIVSAPLRVLQLTAVIHHLPEIGSKRSLFLLPSLDSPAEPWQLLLFRLELFDLSFCLSSSCSTWPLCPFWACNLADAASDASSSRTVDCCCLAEVAEFCFNF